MSNLAQTLFGDSAKNVKFTERLPSFGVGVHFAEITNLKLFTTFGKGDAFIAEFKVLESATEAVGSPKSWYQNLVGLGLAIGTNEIYKLCFAAEGLNVKKLSPEEQAGALLEIQQKLANITPDLYVGAKVRVIGYEKASKKNPGKTFVNYLFEAV